MRCNRLGFGVVLALQLVVCIAQEPQLTEVEGNVPPRPANALADSTSPYLLQHAHNPVNWLPWGPEAFAKAQAENKPIFVSIGYSTCYWCHVMERESFENEEVAQLLNADYVAIKVDREQRPDIDEQLMLATQLMTGRGGWPNSVWLTPDGRPWMAGTYFPRPQFIDALKQLSRIWDSEQEAVQKQADALSQAVRDASAVDSPVQLGDDIDPWQQTLDELGQLYDSVHGGFGDKPKFPPHGSLRILAQAASTGDTSAQKMLTNTLDALWRGGIHDHVGGGFHRYSTDERWFLPHFEKMLYDNAQLMTAFAAAYEITEHPRYREAVEDIFAWLQREMTHPQGGFYSALDSESDGQEGRYYTWSMAELIDVLGKPQAEEFAAVYRFEPQGNFVEEASGHRPGTNLPYLADSLQAVGHERARVLKPLREQLLAARANREYPHLDDKVLASWNGLMISALAKAGRVLDDERFTLAAGRAADFILSEMHSEGSLSHAWRNGRASIPAYLDDYAFLADGFIELHLSTGDPHWLVEAERLTQQMSDRFEDEQDGGFFFTGPEHEELLLRSKNLGGGGNVPTGNGAAALVLLELYRITENRQYLEAAERTVHGLASLLATSPRQVELLVLAYQRLQELE